MTPLRVNRSDAARLQRNVTGKRDTARNMTRAKSELLTPYRDAYMAAKGIRVLTAEIINSAEYVKGLQSYWRIFVPLILERMREEAEC